MRSRQDAHRVGYIIDLRIGKAASHNSSPAYLKKDRIRSTRVADRSSHSLVKVIDILRNEVCQVGVLGVVPQHLHRVEFGSIGGKPLHLEPIRVRLLQQAHGFAMNAVAIQDQDEFAPQLPMDQVEKGDDVIEADVVIMELEVQAHPAPLRRHGESRNGRETVVTIPTVLDRSLPLGRPGAAYHRLEHKAAFVNQDNAPASLAPFF